MPYGRREVRSGCTVLCKALIILILGPCPSSDVHVYLIGLGKTFRKLVIFKTSYDWVPYVGMFCFIFAIGEHRTFLILG